jgi:hypothetical protein
MNIGRPVLWIWTSPSRNVGFYVTIDLEPLEGLRQTRLSLARYYLEEIGFSLIFLYVD